MNRTALTFPLFFMCAAAWPHTITPDGLPADDGPEWWVLLLLAVSLLLYAAGLARLLARTRTGRPTHLRHAAYFCAGWSALAVALASPLDAMGASLFSAHMVQHELLMIVAAPLLVHGRPLGVWAWAMPRRWLRGFGGAFRSGATAAAWRSVTRPLHAWLLHFASLWLWHVPFLFQAALTHPGVHALQHASFLFPALLFWWAVRGTGVANLSSGGAIAYLFTTMLHTGALGALFAMSERIWYPAYGAAATAYGLSPLEDQQLGGLIMWIPGGLAYVIAGLVLCAGWLRPTPRKALP